MSFLFRTHATDLSDDGLIVLDVLFDANVSFRHLRAANFSLQFNTCYSHKLSDPELRALLDEYVDRSFLERRVDNDDGREYWGLTPQGGAVWESERLPLWERYSSGRVPSRLVPGTEREQYHISTSWFVSPIVAQEYLTNCRTLGVREGNGTRIRCTTIRRAPYLIPWKQIEQWHLVSILMTDIRRDDKPRDLVPPSVEEKVDLATRCTLHWHNVTYLQRFM